MQCAALLSAGTLIAPSNWAISSEQREFLAAQRSYIKRKTPRYFNEAQRASVRAIAEHIIPATDTPGAIDAGVPRFIELMVSDWFNDTERGVFMDGLTQLDRKSGGKFAAQDTNKQLSLLTLLEQESADAAWYAPGNFARIWDESAPFICQIKELTVLGFCLSEAAASDFFRRNSMGSFQGDIPLRPDDANYAPELPLRLLFRG